MVKAVVSMLLCILLSAESYSKVSRVGLLQSSSRSDRKDRGYNVVINHENARRETVVRKICNTGGNVGARDSPSSTRLHLIDTDAVSTVGQHISQTGTDTISVAITTFLASASSRLIGILVGNILAAAFVKYVTDIFKNGVSNLGKSRDIEKKENEEKGSELSARVANVSGNSVQIPPDAYFQLALCVAIDLLGDSSFLLPGIGEVEDLAWAPMSAYAMKFMFGSNALAGLDFLKEILPATDIVPLATIAWILTYVAPKNPISDALGLKKDSTGTGTGDSTDVIDV